MQSLYSALFRNEFKNFLNTLYSCPQHIFLNSSTEHTTLIQALRCHGWFMYKASLRTVYWQVLFYG